MSDQSQGEGWWQASDGKWYPPPSPDAWPPPTTQPFESAPDEGKKAGLGRGPIIGIAVAVVVIAGAVAAFLLTRDDGKTNNASTDRSVQTDQTDGSIESNGSSAPVSIPSGFKVLKDDASGVSIGVPNNFDQIDPSKVFNSSNESDASSLNSDLGPLLSAGNSILQSSVLAAAGSADGTPAFVVVAKSPQQFDPSDSQAASELESELQSELGGAGASDISVDKVTLPAGDALRATLTLDLNSADSSGAVHETIYLVTVGRTSWIIFGATAGDSSSVDLFDQIAKTFSVSS
jgi:hypothetical protein